MEFSTTYRGNSVLIYSGYEYLKFRTNNGVVTWRCRQNNQEKCCSFLKTTIDSSTIVTPPTRHSHDSCPQKAMANVAKAQMKEAIKEVGATARNVLGNVLVNVNSDILGHLPKKSSILRSLNQQKQSDRIANPTTHAFTIPEKYSAKILHDTGFDDPDRILVIGNRELLLELNKETIYGDGIFDKCPSMFYQLYTWHALVGTSYPPCIYFLLQKKNREIYIRMFEIMKQLLTNLSPRKVLVDFEKACMTAAAVAFPDAEVKGCYFHLCQSLVRKVNCVGLQNLYESNVDVKLMLKSICALAFVPANEVRSAFDILARTFPDEDPYNAVLSYFFQTYIEGAIGRDPMFPVRIWNQWEAAAEKSPKTTNCCEGFHNALNATYHCSHPSIWLLFDGLQKDIACHRLTLTNYQTGRPEKKKRKYESLHQAVATAVQEYDSHADDESKLKYLRRMANMQ